jgi:hypothetical protein
VKVKVKEQRVPATPTTVVRPASDARIVETSPSTTMVLEALEKSLGIESMGL